MKNIPVSFLRPSNWIGDQSTVLIKFSETTFRLNSYERLSVVRKLMKLLHLERERRSFPFYHSGIYVVDMWSDILYRTENPLSQLMKYSFRLTLDLDSQHHLRRFLLGPAFFHESLILLEPSSRRNHYHAVVWQATNEFNQLFPYDDRRRRKIYQDSRLHKPTEILFDSKVKNTD